MSSRVSKPRPLNASDVCFFADFLGFATLLWCQINLWGRPNNLNLIDLMKCVERAFILINYKLYILQQNSKNPAAAKTKCPKLCLIWAIWRLFGQNRRHQSVQPPTLGLDDSWLSWERRAVWRSGESVRCASVGIVMVFWVPWNNGHHKKAH